MKNIQQFLKLVNETGNAFFTQTVYKGTPGIWAAISNWRGKKEDMEVGWEILKQAYDSYVKLFMRND
ncbi:hypothetical protein [Lacrimispora algidixylanolytica]|uniref:Uncharacterized protein n=1 Tax=Lacrimispora algidixylanolytica TaxID=94868 RepID=A0A419TBZ5_9FIRM|nr:hypothetical protein [Lacrimispora algidixylanolytica]RKD35034.1 hypothetical protein BET01_01395 [Lacrimispora algidixylanolytica]